MAQLII
jgi:hypothetical protein